MWQFQNRFKDKYWFLLINIDSYEWLFSDYAQLDYNVLRRRGVIDSRLSLVVVQN